MDQVVNQIIISLIMIPISALLLMLSTKIFKLSYTKYGKAIKITAILGAIELVIAIVGIYLPAFKTYSWIISFILVSILLAAWLIKSNYSLDWGKSILVWVVWFVLELIVAFVIGIVFASILLTMAFGG